MGRDGRVMDVITQRVNLGTLMAERDFDRFRKVLATASENAVKKWTFHVPTEVELKDAPFWVMQVPISFRFRGDSKPNPWNAYIPGPFQRIPEHWSIPKAYAEAAPDALPEGGVYLVGQKTPKLLTELDGI